MNTRKTFMKAGGIIGIVSAGITMLTGLMLLFSIGVINYEFVVEILETEGIIAEYTEEMINMIVSVTRGIYIVMSIFVLGLAIANLALSVKVIKQANAGSLKKGAVIALLVVSLLIGNLVTFAFMITALCLNKKQMTPMSAGTDIDHEEQYPN